MPSTCAEIYDFTFVPPFVSMDVDLPDKFIIGELKEYGSLVNYKQKENIIEFGDNVDGLYLVIKGEASARMISPDGDERLVFVMKPYCIFGETPHFNKARSNLQIEVYPGTTLFYCPQNKIDTLKMEKPFFAQLLIRSITKKTQILTESLHDIHYLTAEQRFCKSLQYLCANLGIESENKYTLNLTQEEIANFVGLSRVTVARLYGRMKNKNIIEKEHKSKRHLIVDKVGLSKYIARSLMM